MLSGDVETLMLYDRFASQENVTVHLSDQIDYFKPSMTEFADGGQPH